MSAGTVSDSVKALVSKGLVERSAHPTDARVSLVVLTPDGAREARAASSWPDALAGAIDTLGPEEQATLLVALTKLIGTLQAEGRIPVARMCVSCEHFRPNVHPSGPPHHCAFVDAAFGDPQLRMDCLDHRQASAAARVDLLRRFAAPRSGA